MYVNARFFNLIYMNIKMKSHVQLMYIELHVATPTSVASSEINAQGQNISGPSVNTDNC